MSSSYCYETIKSTYSVTKVEGLKYPLYTGTVFVNLVWGTEVFPSLDLDVVTKGNNDDSLLV